SRHAPRRARPRPRGAGRAGRRRTRRRAAQRHRRRPLHGRSRRHRGRDTRFPPAPGYVMLMQMDEMQARLDALVEALDGQDPGTIIAASEALATAVILFRNSTIPAGTEQRARLLITRTLGQLEAAA